MNEDSRHGSAGDVRPTDNNQAEDCVNSNFESQAISDRFTDLNANGFIGSSEAFNSIIEMESDLTNGILPNGLSGHFQKLDSLVI